MKAKNKALMCALIQNAEAVGLFLQLMAPKYPFAATLCERLKLPRLRPREYKRLAEMPYDFERDK